MIDKMQQQIWCISADKLFTKGKWQGVRAEEPEYYIDLLNNHGEFKTRGPLETDPSYKQIIGQVLLQVGDKFLLHQITTAGSESRLHNMWPLVVGGHMEPIDQVEGQDLLTAAIEREFREEVNYTGNILQREFIGLIYVENDNPVNEMHVGLAYRFVGDTEAVNPSEAEIANMSFVDLDFINDNIDKLTYWSREIVPILSTFTPKL